MASWLDRYADALGLPPLTDDEVRELLALARDVAHGSERRHAPLSTFLAGMLVARRGEDRAEALATARQAAVQLLPDDPTTADDDGPDEAGDR